MSYKTAVQLGLLSVSSDVLNSVVTNDVNDIVGRFPNVFKGIGELKGFTVKLHIDENVEPVAQPVRRLPFGLRDKIKNKLNELLAGGIIERVEGVGTSWVSPLVAILQDSGEIRQTVDMRQANRAILRERHPIPTVKERLAA